MSKLSSVFSCIALLCASGLALAQSGPQREIRFDVPSQPLNEALNKFAEQSSLRIVYYTDVTEGVTAPALTGSHTPEGALKLLLSNSKLTYEFVNERTVRISAAGARAPASGGMQPSGKPRESAATGELASLRLAQTEPGRGMQRSQTAEEPPAAQEQEDKGVPEILVKGNKLLNMDIRRTEDDARPYVVFDREMIERSGAVDLQDFLKNRLSMGTSSFSESQSPASTSGNTSSVNLRGLGADETLILVDGRRLPAYSVRGSTAQPDINGIPLSAIERIEVLPATASGIYGGSATGGVVNIIMRRDYSGLETKLSYNNTFDTDVAMKRIELSSGFNLGSKTSVLLSGSWSDSDALLTQDRDFAVRMRQLIMRNDPGSILNSTTPPLGATTNIRSSNGAPLVLKSGGAPFSAAQTFVPYGYAGPDSDNGALLRANAGQYNLDLADNAATGAGQGKRLALRNSPTVKSLMGSLRHEFTPHLSAFVEASSSENIGVFTRSPLFFGIRIPASSAGNPFNQEIRVTLPSAGTDAQDDANLTTYRVAGGLIAELPGGWSSGLDYTWGRTRLTNALLGRAYGAGIIGAVADQSINIFRDLDVYPIDFNEFITSRIRRSPTVTTLQDLSLRFSGPLPFISLPGGVPTLSTLLEQRREKFGDQIEFFPAAPGLFFNTLWPGRSQRINSVHAELLFPFISEQNNVPGVRKLELQIAARHDRYNTLAAGPVDVDDDGVPFSDIVYFRNKLTSTDVGSPGTELEFAL